MDYAALILNFFTDPNVYVAGLIVHLFGDWLSQHVKAGAKFLWSKAFG